MLEKRRSLGTFHARMRAVEGGCSGARPPVRQPRLRGAKRFVEAFGAFEMRLSEVGTFEVRPSHKQV